MKLLCVYISAGWVDIKYKLSKQPFSSDSLQGQRTLDKNRSKIVSFLQKSVNCWFESRFALGSSSCLFGQTHHYFLRARDIYYVKASYSSTNTSPNRQIHHPRYQIHLLHGRNLNIEKGRVQGKASAWHTFFIQKGRTSFFGPKAPDLIRARHKPRISKF